MERCMKKIKHNYISTRMWRFNLFNYHSISISLTISFTFSTVPKLSETVYSGYMESETTDVSKCWLISLVSLWVFTVAGINSGIQEKEFVWDGEKRLPVKPKFSVLGLYVLDLFTEVLEIVDVAIALTFSFSYIFQGHRQTEWFNKKYSTSFLLLFAFESKNSQTSRICFWEEHILNISFNLCLQLSCEGVS